MIINGDCLDVLKTMPDNSINCCVTSPPYFGLRDYGVKGQLGLEKTPEEYISNLVKVFREVRRVLRDDGTLWLNLGDSYGKNKQLHGIPWRVALALQADGYTLRQDIIWNKPNVMPESVKDRCTKSHEYMFLLSKTGKYHFDHKAIKEPAKLESIKRLQSGWNGNENRGDPTGVNNHLSKYYGSEKAKSQASLRNKRSVWTVTTKSFKGAHFATFPPDLIEPCILAGCPKDGIVLDPFSGAGTTGLVAAKHGMEYIGIELNPEYVKLSEERLK